MRELGLLVVAAVALCVVVACGSANEVTLDTARRGQGGESGEVGGGLAVGGGGGGPGFCPEATGVYAVEPAPSNLLFLVDRSGSMHLRVGADETRWTLTKAGLFDLLEALPASMTAGLELFPTGDQPVTCCVITWSNAISCAACGPGELPGPARRCDPAAYHDLHVPLAPLTGPQRSELKAAASTVDDEFYWGTPLAPAIEGAIEALADQPLAGVRSVVMLTDGLPTSCDTPSDPLANDVQRAIDAAAAGVSDHAIRTYVLGVIDGTSGADPDNISRIAQAGGTARYPGCEASDDCAYRINVDSFTSDLSAALASIALEAISCSFELPDVEGGAPDYDQVNITISSEGAVTAVPRDTGHADGWDYLAGNQQVQLYGSPCETLKADPDAEVAVVVGCTTLE